MKQLSKKKISLLRKERKTLEGKLVKLEKESKKLLRAYRSLQKRLGRYQLE